MKERVLTKENSNKKYSRNLKINHFSPVKIVHKNFQMKQEKLFGNKSFLEIILGLIKNTQNDILNKGTTFHKISDIKMILNVLHNDLLEIKREKEKELNLNECIKKEKEKHFFELNHVDKCTINSSHNDLNKNTDSLMVENNEKESYHELTQLKMMNFKVSNEIQKVENLSRRKIFEINYYKMSSNIIMKKNNIIYINNNEKEIINQILHNKLIRKRKIFIECANMKNNQDNCVNYISDKIKAYKNHLKALNNIREKKMNGMDKINFIETIVENTENDEFSINNNIFGNSIEFDIKDNNIFNDENDSIEKNNSIKESTCNEETNCNSCEKNGLSVK